MDLNRVGKKAQKVLGPGRIFSDPPFTAWFYESSETGAVTHLGSTLKEAWHSLAEKEKRLREASEER